MSSDADMQTYRAALDDARRDLADAEERRAQCVQKLSDIYTQVQRLANVINA